jgi:hypothetical protein
MRKRRVFLVLTVLVLLLLGGPAWVLLSGQASLRGDWSTASRHSAGIAPDPAKTRDAVVQVYAARAFSWRGVLGVHTWIAAKPANASAWTTYQVIGWNVMHGGKAVAIRKEAPDRYWFGNRPEVVADLRGEGVDAIIRDIDRAAHAYPYNDDYTVWPGPNSNTFVAWIAREVPGLGLDLPPTAVGKDWLGATTIAARAPSGTGFQVSLFGLLGFTAALEEGLEFNLVGLTIGVDPLDLALKLPGVGRVGPDWRHAAHAGDRS